MMLELPVTLMRPMVIPGLDGAYPSYFVYGSLAFSEANRESIGQLTGEGEVGTRWMKWLSGMGSPLMKRISDRPAFDGERLVMISSPLFPHKLSKGYSNPILQVVKSINGQCPKNLGHLVEILRDCKDEFITIDMDNMGGETLVFRRKETLETTEEILSDNGVRSQGSPDMLAIWNAKASK